MTPITALVIVVISSIAMIKYLSLRSEISDLKWEHDMLKHTVDILFKNSFKTKYPNSEPQNQNNETEIN